MLSTLAVSLLCQTTAPSNASAPPPEPAWTFTVEPFLWVPTVQGHGETDSSGRVGLDRTFPDALGELDAGFLLAFEAVAPSSRYSLIGDGLYVRLEDENGSVNSKTEASMIEAGAGVPIGRGGVEAIAGLRWVDLSLDVDLGQVDSHSSKSWVDPWVGARWRWKFAEDWALELRGDVGGFGVGTDFSWQAIGAVRVALGDHCSIVGGYRAIALDFSDSDLSYDTVVHGPIIGLAFTW